jgi:hypothetical protein
MPDSILTSFYPLITELYTLKVLVSPSYVFLILVLFFIETLIPALMTRLGGSVINN